MSYDELMSSNSEYNKIQWALAAIDYELETVREEEEAVLRRFRRLRERAREIEAGALL